MRVEPLGAHDRLGEHFAVKMRGCLALPENHGHTTSSTPSDSKNPSWFAGSLAHTCAWIVAPEGRRVDRTIASLRGLCGRGRY